MYEHTDEQIEALARDAHNLAWSPDAWEDAHPEHQQELREQYVELASMPAFQAIIRAAQADALREAARNLPFPADPYGGFSHESLRAAQVQHTNWLRETADA